MKDPVGRTRNIVLFFSLILCAAAAPCLAQEQPNFYAVVIGVSQFANLPKEEWLEYADADARDFAKFLSSPRGRAFPAENVKVFSNDGASLTAVKRWMGSTLAKKVKAEDTVYIFVATHGMVEKEAAKAGYLLTHDSDREDLYTSALPMKELADIIQNRLKNAKRIVLFADACRAGKLGQGQGNVSRAVEDASRRGEMMGLLASRPNEFSREGKQFGGGHGVFTYFLLKGLMGEADGDKDKTVTASEIVTYLQMQVPTATDKQQNVRDFGEFEAATPLAFVDKDGPADLKLTGMPRPQGTEIASLRPFLMLQAPGQEIRAEFGRAIADGRLVTPATNNAWELFQRYAQQAVPQDLKDAMQEELIVALGTAGDKVLAAYRRGDQVVRLDAARYDEGAQLFARAAQLDPDEPAYKAKGRFMAGRALVANGRYAEAIGVLREAMALDPDAAYTYNALGVAYMQQGQWNEAITNFQSALQRAEKWVYPRFNLAVVYAALNRFPQAEQEYKTAITVGTELGMRYSYLHNNLGVLYLQQGRLNEAEAEFRRALQMRADDAATYHNMGLLFERRNNAAQAEQSFLRAASLDARFSAPRMRLADLYRTRGRRDQEEKVLREAVAGDPQNHAVLEALGSVLLNLKRLDEAEQAFVQMMSLNPTSPVPLSWLGDVHAEQRNFTQAADDYREALNRTNDDKFRRELQKKLSAVEKKK